MREKAVQPNLVSILMPAFNGARYVHQAIESVLAQTHCRWELVIVDDGSTDDTAKLIAAFKDVRIRYSFQSNRGQAAALNRGLAMANGQYITTLDTDDWLTPTSLSQRVHFLNTHPEFGVVYGDGCYCDVNGRLLRLFSEHRGGDFVGDVYDTLITHPFFGTGGNVMVRQQILETHRICYDESIVWCQDYDLYIRLAEKTSFGLVEGVTIWYRLHNDNMTLSMARERQLRSLIRTKLKVLDSPRFQAVPTPQKVAFFQQLLIVDCHTLWEEQAAFLEHPHFRALPGHAQARLLRGVAKQHALEGERPEFARACLRKALILAPLDLKTGLLAILVSLNPALARQLLSGWRQRFSGKGRASVCPLEMVRATQHPTESC